MINGITCTNAMVQKVAALLINIHGQHDNQLLLNEASHIKLVDSFGYDTISPLKDNYSLIYKEFSQLRSKLEKNTMDEESREREISFLEFEINEINEADLKEGEDEDLEAEFKKLNNSKKIIDNISQALQVLSDSNDNCNDLLGSAIHHISNASTYDDSLSDILASL
jgi:DNA repair protein RecN (Recombination protein N)